MASGDVAVSLRMHAQRRPPTDQSSRWSRFYNNGTPSEVIVIEDTPPTDEAHAATPARTTQRVRSVGSDAGPAGPHGPQAGNSGNSTALTPRSRLGVGNGPLYDDGSEVNASTSQIAAPSAPTFDMYGVPQSPQTAATAAAAAAAAIFQQSLPSTTWHPMMSSTYRAQPSAYIPSTLSSSNAPSLGTASTVSTATYSEQGSNRRASKRKIDLVDSDFRSPLHNGYKAPKRPTKISNVTVPLVQCSESEKLTKCDDTEGHFLIKENTYITPRYRILRLLGQGTFGKVVECYDEIQGNHCAIKIIRAVQKYRDASMIELRVLKTLSDNDPNNTNKCIHLRECFDFRQHICLVMDLLGLSVFDFLKANNYQPFPLEHIRSFAKQLLTSVAFLHDLNLIHTDLKPENILLVDHSADAHQIQTRRRGRQTQQHQQSTKNVLRDTDIRLIDFGSATFADEYHSHVVSTRHYRAPEIIVGCGWSYPCDLWSVACILAELYTGQALFQTHDNLEHLAMMEVIIGKMDPTLYKNASRQAQAFFKGPSELDYPRHDTPKASIKYVKALKPLDKMFPPTSRFNQLFVDLLRMLLIYDPKKRWTARQALNHPFFGPELDEAFGVVGY